MTDCAPTANAGDVSQHLRLLKKRHPEICRRGGGSSGVPTPSVSCSGSPQHAASAQEGIDSLGAIATTPPQRGAHVAASPLASGVDRWAAAAGGYAQLPAPAAQGAQNVGREPLSRIAEPQPTPSTQLAPKTSARKPGAAGPVVSPSAASQRNRAATTQLPPDAAAEPQPPEPQKAAMPPTETAPPVRPNLGLSLAVTTEDCPHCGRNFSSEAAARHVPICAKLRTRPKPPQREQGAVYTDVLGIRQGSRGALATTKKTEAPHSPNGSSASCAASPASNGSLKSAASSNRRGGCPAGGARPRSAKPVGSRSSPEPPEASVPVSPQKAQLSAQWSQLEFLLKDGLEALYSEKSVAETRRTAERCLDFLVRLEEQADTLGMRKGQLSRLLLPFDLNTDAGYQANSVHELGSDELRGRMTDEVRRELVADAVALRRLIRVKIADCADVDQAKDAVVLLVDFLRNLQGQAADLGTTTTAVLREL